MATRTLTRTNTASAQDTELISVIAGANSVSAEIPSNATLADIDKTLSVAINAYKRLTEASERLKPVIGRILLEVSNRKLFKGMYRNFTEYVRKHVGEDLGFGPTNAFDSLRIAKAFPTLSTEDYHRIGASRLLLASRVTDETKPDYLDVLEQAKESPTVEAFKQVVNEIKDQAPKRIPAKPIVAIRVTDAAKQRWEEICKEEPERDRGEIFEAMLDIWAMRDQLTRKLPMAQNVRSRAKVG